MILSIFRIGALGVLAGGLTVQAAAADREAPTVAAPADNTDRAGHSRQVELPFLLDFRPSENEPRRPAPRDKAGPHPLRDLQPEQPIRASLHTGRTHSLRLSPRVDFS